MTTPTEKPLDTQITRNLEHMAESALDYLEAVDYRGHDPYDIWGVAPWRFLLPPPKGTLRRLTRAAALRTLRRRPRAGRRLFGVPMRVQAETLANAAEALYLLDRGQAADEILRRLDGLAVAGGRAWSLGFDHPGAVPLQRDTPTLTVTLKAYQAYAAGARLAGRSEAAARCRTIASWIASVRPHPAEEGVCFPYVPGDALRVHNANLAAAEILAEEGSRHGETGWLDLAGQALRYWVADWERGGGFEYLGPESRGRSQTDHTHTALVVRSLTAMAPLNTTAASVLPAVVEEYVTRYFEDGIPCAPGDRGWTDGRAFAESLRALLALGEAERSARLVKTIVERMTTGRTFAYRVRRRDWRLDRTAYVRWVHAPLTTALCEALRELA